MASSPTSSSYSAAFASSSSSSTGKLSGLPVTAQRDRIVEKIQENRVTLIVGETGCGKSSQVPQFLLQENMEPILCTQPRRFAVVAVARMVAKARNCEVGGEVGYHIGHSSVFSSRSKIVFKTAGVLLDEIRDKGLNALKYKVIILDEVHERSVESDLVLVCVKQLLLKKVELRLVLMSATADISRYRDYFKELGRGERVEVLAIPISPQHTIFQRRVLYLEQVIELLGMKSDGSYEKYCSGPSPITADAEIKLELHKLIHDLVLHIHKNEPDIEKSILVFLPTYYCLEQQWSLLKPFTSDFRVHILHRSVDTEQALKAMKICKSHRKVILATNIAESSVTIPKVAFVIDSCRSLQVFWDNNRKTDAAELVWVSKSQAEQRKGRTGRTCDGQIYRLVTKVFFNQLQEFEPPSILRLSLRQQVLLICCADSKAINDPKVLLQKALDPPDPEVVEDALSLLFHIRALEKASPRGRSVPTFYGRLLASFSLSFDASVLILKFGDIGMLREGILVGILMDMQPLPILRPFGQEHLFVEYTNSYYSGDTRKTGLSGRKELLVMGNVCAFQFWQRVFKDKHRLGRLKHLLKFEEVNETESLFSKIEEEWCLFHNLVQSSLHQVSEIYEDVLSSLHRFRPKFLVKSDGVPYYYDPYEFRHTCLLQSEQAGDTDALAEDDDDLLEPDNSPRKCVSLPFVASSHFQNDNVAEKFAAIVKEIRVQFADTEEISGNQIKHVDFDGLQVYGEPSLCRFFLNGSCNRGSQCMFSHSLQAKRPICKFFFSLQGCRKGESCYYSHDLPPSPSSQNQETSFGQPEDQETDPSSLLRLLPKPPDGRILLLDDTNFHFSSHLSRIYDPSSIISTTSLPESSTIDPSLADISIQWGLSHPYQTIISETGECSIPWNEVKCVLWVPMFHIEGENPELYRRLLKNFFDYLAIRILADALHEIRVVLTMKNIRFSQLQVEKLARESFFFLKESFPFDESSFGGVFDEITTNRPMVVAKPISYVFDLHPPTDIQFGDYTAVLRQCLNSSSIS